MNGGKQKLIARPRKGEAELRFEPCWGLSKVGRQALMHTSDLEGPRVLLGAALYFLAQDHCKWAFNSHILSGTPGLGSFQVSFLVEIGQLSKKLKGGREQNRCLLAVKLPGGGHAGDTAAWPHPKRHVSKATLKILEHQHKKCPPKTVTGNPPVVMVYKKEPLPWCRPRHIRRADCCAELIESCCFLWNSAKGPVTHWLGWIRPGLGTQRLGRQELGQMF